MSAHHRHPHRPTPLARLLQGLADWLRRFLTPHSQGERVGALALVPIRRSPTQAPHRDHRGHPARHWRD